MIILKASIEIKPDFVSQFRDLLPPFLAQSRAEEGCLSFTIGQDIEHSNRYTFLAEWVHHLALASHEASTHVAEFKAQIRDWIVVKAPTQIYEVHHHHTL